MMDNEAWLENSKRLLRLLTEAQVRELAHCLNLPAHQTEAIVDTLFKDNSNE